MVSDPSVTIDIDPARRHLLVALVIICAFAGIVESFSLLWISNFWVGPINRAPSCYGRSSERFAAQQLIPE